MLNVGLKKYCIGSRINLCLLPDFSERAAVASFIDGLVTLPGFIWVVFFDGFLIARVPVLIRFVLDGGFVGLTIRLVMAALSVVYLNFKQNNRYSEDTIDLISWRRDPA